MKARGDVENPAAIIDLPSLEGAPAPIFELSHIWKIHEIGDTTVEAAKDVSLVVRQGEFVAITGPSGSGKSTLLQVMGLLDQPTYGTISFRGEAVEALTDAEISTVRNREVGFVFQSFHLLPRATAMANVELPLLYRGIDADERSERAYEALCMVGLEDRMDHLPAQLSGGQRQRVAMARAIAGSPAIVLADEPTGNLDSRTGAEIMGLLTRLNREVGVAIVLITHDPEVARYADREYHMRDGVLRRLRDSRVEPTGCGGTGNGLVLPAPRRPRREPLVAAPIGVSAPVAASTTSTSATSTSTLVLERPTPRARVSPGGSSVHGVRAARADQVPSPVHEVADKALAVVATAGRLATWTLPPVARGTRIADVVRMSFTSLVSNGLRSILTSLGVIIGVMAMVLLVALGTGVRNAVSSEIEGLGSNILLVMPGSGDLQLGFLPASPLTTVDLDELSAKLGPESLVGGAQLAAMQAATPQAQALLNITGSTINAPELMGLAVSEGRFFSPEEAQAGEKVLVLSESMAKKMFPNTSALGNQVVLKGNPFTVIGLITSQGGTVGGLGKSDLAYMPTRTMGALLNRPTLDLAYVRAPSSKDLKAYSAIIKAHLREKYPQDQLTVAGQEDLMGIASKFFSIFTFGLAGIAGVSLIVGGVGIMNVTLVSVTERTREIGIRRAIGARADQVLFQFILEATVTAACGGVIGLGLAMALSWVAGVVTPVPAQVTPWIIVLALAVSTATGLLSGVWPARRAAALDPVQALRHE